MFTIKFYSEGRQRILSAESFTMVRGDDRMEITLHQKNMVDDVRIDIAREGTKSADIYYQRAIIENSAGRTTEIISAHSLPLELKAE